MQVEWYGDTYAVRELTVQQYVDWLVGVAWEFVSEPDEYAFDALVNWIVEHTHDLNKARCLAIISLMIEDEQSMLEMCFDIIDAQRSTRWDAMKKSLRIREGLPTDYKPTSGTGCECARCSGLSKDATDCRYVAEEVGVIDRMVANLNLELALTMMDQPFWMYDLRQEQMHASSLGRQYKRDNPPDQPGGNHSRQQRHDAISARMRSRYHRRA